MGRGWASDFRMKSKWRKWWWAGMCAGYLLGWPAAWGGTFYVSPDGGEQGDGTEAKPFATLTQAVAASRSLPQGSARRIVMRGGEYFEVAVQLGPADSGLVIEAAPGEVRW